MKRDNLNQKGETGQSILQEGVSATWQWNEVKMSWYTNENSSEKGT